MVDVTSYVNKKTETDLPYFAGGLLISGMLMTALPLALPKNNEVAQLIRTGTAGLATVQVAFAGCFWRRVHRKLIPHWQEIDTLIAEYQSKLLDLELSENFDKEMSQSIARTMAYANVTLEAEVKPMSQQPSVITPNHQQLERMFWEGDDQVRNWMREKGLFNPEKQPEVPENKGFSDSTSTTTPTTNSQESLVENSSGSEAGSVPEGHLEAIYALIQGGMSLSKAIALIAGVKGGSKFSKYSKAYKAKYEGK